MVTLTPGATGYTDQRGTVTVTRQLLRLCAEVKPPPGVRPENVRNAHIAFVLAHELAHLARRDAGSFGNRAANQAVEKDADEKAVGRLVVAGFDVERLQLPNLLRAIGRETGTRVAPGVAAGRERGVRAALKDAKRCAREWHVGWMLTVGGRFDQAIAFHASVAWKYPYPTPMYALALTRLHAAWRRSPCSDSELSEWLPPLRYDPRSQVTPFDVRSVDNACAAFTRELMKAEEEFGQVRDYPPAQIALASLRLLQGPHKATIDPTRSIGGVKLVATGCPQPAPGARPALVEADACHVSLLAQYEVSGRSPAARQVAIDGLRQLRQHWPSDPLLQFNLARLLMHAHEEEEARPLWAAFLETAGQGIHRREAQLVLSRGVAIEERPSAAAGDPTAPASVGSQRSADRLRVSNPACRPSRNWSIVLPLSSVSYCGDWSDEIGVRNRAGNLIRSVAVGSKAWPNTQPPSTQPLFVTTSATGEELRVWEEEAWVFDEKTPATSRLLHEAAVVSRPLSVRGSLRGQGNP